MEWSSRSRALRSAFPLGALSLLVACQTPKPAPAPPVPAEEPAPPAAEAVTPESIALSLCGESEGCQLVEATPAGVDARGAALHVLELAIPNPETSEEMVFECRPHRRRFYRVATPVGAPPETVLLLDLCNDGYGAAGLGEDEVTVKDGRLTHWQAGGSSSRWTSTNTLDLDPLALRAQEFESTHIMMAVNEASDIDWSTLEGETRMYQADCGPDGTPIVDDEGELAADFNFRSLTLPQLESFSFDPATTALGACAARVTSDGSAGYVTFGQPGAVGDGEMKALLLGENVLVVEVIDDTFVGTAKSWLYEDHLEIWRGQVGQDQTYGCVSRGGETLYQWGVTLDDGQVFPAHGKPGFKPTVVRTPFTEDGRSGVRLTLTFPEAPGERPTGWTVVFSDSDDGKTQERLIATSQLRFGDAHTLGYTQIVDPARARCVEADGALTVDLTPLTVTDGAISLP